MQAGPPPLPTTPPLTTSHSPLFPAAASHLKNASGGPAPPLNAYRLSHSPAHPAATSYTPPQKHKRVPCAAAAAPPPLPTPFRPPALSRCLLPPQKRTQGPCAAAVASYHVPTPLTPPPHPAVASWAPTTASYHRNNASGGLCASTATACHFPPPSTAPVACRRLSPPKERTRGPHAAAAASYHLPWRSSHYPCRLPPRKHEQGDMRTHRPLYHLPPLFATPRRFVPPQNARGAQDSGIARGHWMASTGRSVSNDRGH
jgi:hypothetical protein